MKSLIQTTRPILLIDPTTRQIVTHNRPHVVDFSSFFEARTGKGEIKVITADLPAAATDAEFEACLKDSDGDVELAVAAFLSIVAPEPEQAPKPKPKPEPKPKAEA